jgi:hypothetical protein
MRYWRWLGFAFVILAAFEFILSILYTPTGAVLPPFNIGYKPDFDIVAERGMYYEIIFTMYRTSQFISSWGVSLTFMLAAIFCALMNIGDCLRERGQG